MITGLKNYYYKLKPPSVYLLALTDFMAICRLIHSLGRKPSSTMIQKHKLSLSNTESSYYVGTKDFITKLSKRHVFSITKPFNKLGLLANNF